MTGELGKEDPVVFLVPGGSALFEMPMEEIRIEDIMDISDQLLRSGADIVEINTVRKHLSKVKGGKFAEHCRNTNIFSVSYQMRWVILLMPSHQERPIGIHPPVRKLLRFGKISAESGTYLLYSGLILCSGHRRIEAHNILFSGF